MARTRSGRYGEEACSILTSYIFLRERLRPYLHAAARETSRTGLPLMRPLLLEFPEDKRCWDVDDQFMFGPDLLVAPVLERHASNRSVYLPGGTGWTDAWSGAHEPGGAMVTRERSAGTDPAVPPRRGAARYRYLREGQLISTARVRCTWRGPRIEITACPPAEPETW